MMDAGMVYDYPTWLSGLVIVLAIVAGSMLAQVATHRFIPVSLRQQDNPAVIAIFSIIGLTYAVLLAFVAMLTWEGFNRARAATFEEAGTVAELHRLCVDLPPAVAQPLGAKLDDYVRTVVGTEWPAQAHGRVDLSAEMPLRALHAVIGQMHPDGVGASNVQTQFLSELASLSAARQGRLLAVQATVPGVVWVVLLVGGGLMVLFSAMVGARSYALHLVMTGALAASGALVIVLIVSLDSPFRSDFAISPEAFRMQSATPAAQ